MLEGEGGHVGQLRYDGGVKLTADDPRFGGLIGIQFDETYGLVGLSAAGDWIVLDSQGASLLDIKTAMIGPMKGVHGAPMALSRTSTGYVAAFDDGRSINRYDVATCGFGALPSPIGGIKPPEHLVAMAQVGFNYSLFAGIDSTGARRDLVVRAPGADMVLAAPEVPAVPGYELVAAAGPQSVNPVGMIGLWRPFGGGARTRIQLFDMRKFSTTGPSGRQTSAGQVLASVPMALRAVTSYLDTERDILHIWTATAGGAGQPLYLFGFSIRLS